MEENEKLIESNAPVEENELINPDDIIFTEDDDADMPTPDTEQYGAGPEGVDQNASRILKPTYKFMKLFEECLGKLPYAAILKNQKNEQIKLTDLMRFVEAKSEQMTVGEMNTIISFIAQCPTEFVRPLMDIIEDSKRQTELWSVQ